MLWTYHSIIIYSGVVVQHHFYSDYSGVVVQQQHHFLYHVCMKQKLVISCWCVIIIRVYSLLFLVRSGLVPPFTFPFIFSTVIFTFSHAAPPLSAGIVAWANFFFSKMGSNPRESAANFSFSTGRSSVFSASKKKKETKSKNETRKYLTRKNYKI